MSAFTKIVDPATVQATPKRFDLTASEPQRRTIAQRLDLLDLPVFTARLALCREAGADILRLEGEIEAAVVQRCVATLEPVESAVAHGFVERYGTEPEGPADEIVVQADEDADLDRLPPGGLDIAEIAVQHLSLALDPYPRAPGAEPGWSGAGEGEPEGPFAKLKVLKGGKG